MSKCLHYTQYGLCVLPTGVAVVPMLLLYLLRSVMSKFLHYTQYNLCALPAGVAVVPMLIQYSVHNCVKW